MMRIKIITIIINNFWPASSEVTTKHAALPSRNVVTVQYDSARQIPKSMHMEKAL